jgi:hypothetical protein
MKQIIYALQFRGQATPTGENSMTASTTAYSCNIRTTIGAEGLAGIIEQANGDSASFESEVTLTGGTGFQESGTITFGSGSDRIHFSTIGEGYLNSSVDANFKQGAITWKIDRGEGQFAGASGLITSNFTVSDTGEVVDNHFGVIFLK